MKNGIIYFFTLNLCLISSSTFAQILSEDSAGNIIADMPGYELTVYTDGRAELKGRIFDCSSAEKSYIIDGAVLNCSASKISLASPAGSFSYIKSTGKASVVLTSGDSENRTYRPAIEESAEIEGLSSDSDNLVLEVTNTKDSNISSAEIVAGEAQVNVDSSEGRKKVTVENPGEATRQGMNTLGGVLGGMVEANSGDKQAAQDTAKGLGVVGNMLGGMVDGLADTVSQNGHQIAVRKNDGTEIRIDNGAIKASSNGKSWRIISDSENLDEKEIMQELKVQETNNQIQIDMPDSVLFDFNSATIKPAASKTLNKVAYLIKQKSSGKVHIEGHADSVGAEAANMELSKKRVTSVINWLSEAEGIPADIFQGMAFGESKPIAHNTNPDGSDNPQGRQKNRRVTFVFETK